MEPDDETLTYLDEIEIELTEISKSGNRLPQDVANLLLSLLQYCAANGMKTLCQLLMKLNIETETDGSEWTPLMHSIRHGHKDVSQSFLNYTDSTAFNSYDLISGAIASGNLNLVQYLLDELKMTSSKINLLGQMTFTTTACTYGFTDIVKYFLSHYPDEMNKAVEKTGMTPLMLAVAGRHSLIVKLLLLHGADTSPTNVLGQTVFDIALSVNDDKIMTLLGIEQPKTPICCNSDQFTFQHLLPTLPGSNLKLSPGHLLSTSNIFDYSPQCLTCTIKNGHENHPPLTPNIFLSPRKSSYSNVVDDQKKPDIRKRSRSLENMHKTESKLCKYSEDQHLLDSILEQNNLSEVSTLFQEHEITMRTFLSMDEEDLVDIGIQKIFIRQKLLDML